MESVEQPGLWRPTALRQHHQLGGGLFTLRMRQPIVLAGTILLSAGFVFTLGVHFSLGCEWRSGIDPDGPAALKTSGFYRFSRNPMFLGIATAQAGFFLALPSVFSAVCLLIGWYTLHQHTLAEETHLRARFTKNYKHYTEDVPRWL